MWEFVAKLVVSITTFANQNCDVTVCNRFAIVKWFSHKWKNLFCNNACFFLTCWKVLICVLLLNFVNSTCQNFLRLFFLFVVKTNFYFWNVVFKLFYPFESSIFFVINSACRWSHNVVKNKVYKTKNLFVTSKVYVQIFCLAMFVQSVTLFQVQKYLWFASAETINRLFYITNQKFVVLSTQKFDQLVLYLVCVLIFVHKNIFVSLLQFLLNVTVWTNFYRIFFQIAVIHQVFLRLVIFVKIAKLFPKLQQQNRNVFVCRYRFFKVLFFHKLFGVVFCNKIFYLSFQVVKLFENFVGNIFISFECCQWNTANTFIIFKKIFVGLCFFKFACNIVEPSYILRQVKVLHLLQKYVCFLFEILCRVQKVLIQCVKRNLCVVIKKEHCFAKFIIRRKTLWKVIQLQDYFNHVLDISVWCKILHNQKILCRWLACIIGQNICQNFLFYFERFFVVSNFKVWWNAQNIKIFFQKSGTKTVNCAYVTCGNFVQNFWVRNFLFERVIQLLFHFTCGTCCVCHNKQIFWSSKTAFD